MSLKAKELGSDVQGQKMNSQLHLFVLLSSSSSMYWMMLTCKQEAGGWGARGDTSSLLSILIQMLIFQKHPQQKHLAVILPVVWASLSPAKLINKSNHYLGCEHRALKIIKIKRNNGIFWF